MASQTQGIQQLLAAEKRAAEKVAEAKKSKFSSWQTLVATHNFTRFCGLSYSQDDDAFKLK